MVDECAPQAATGYLELRGCGLRAVAVAPPWLLRSRGVAASVVLTAGVALTIGTHGRPWWP